MTGNEEEIIDRLQVRVDAFSEILGKDLELRKADCGSTDTKTFINVPTHEYDSYLVGEHELSHCLFGTDLQLAEETQKKVVERLINRTGMKITEPAAQIYAPKLAKMFHSLWNLLEDRRCCGLWTQLYAGGGALLTERWRDIAIHDYSEEMCEKDLVTFLGRYSCGVETPTASPEYQHCRAPMQEAVNLVEGVDAAACLAISARLIDKIADELLDNYPPDRKEEAKQKMQKLAGAGGEPQPEDQPAKGQDVPGAPGSADVVQPAGKQAQMPAAKKIMVDRLIGAKDGYDEDTGMSPFQALMSEGADKMEARLEEAKKALGVPKKSEEETKKEVLKNACKSAQISGYFVDPMQALPKSTPAAAKVRYHLDQVKMRRRRRLAEEGDDIDPEGYIAACIEDDHDEARYFEKILKESGLELLILIDVSGSMSGYGLSIVDQAIADVSFACASPTVTLTLWGFSNCMYFFRKVGSPIGARNMHMEGTQMVQALEVAADWARASKGTRAIVLMTDGMPTSIRAHKTTGSALGDLHAVLEEMRTDGIVLSVLGIASDPNWAAIYDRGFGKGGYALLTNINDLKTALPETCKQLVEAHIKKGTR